MSSRILAFVCLSIFVSAFSCAFAQDGARRDAAIAKLVQAQVEKSGETLLDDDVLNALILRFRKGNPDTSEETWRQIKVDVKASFLRLLSEDAGPLAPSVREVMPQFTTEDIERLVAIHSDPLLVRYNTVALAALRKPSAQLSLRMAIERAVVEMNDLVIKRGMKPAY